MKISHSELLNLLNYDRDTGVFTHKYNAFRTDLIGQVAGYISYDGYRLIKIRRCNYRSS